MPVISVVNAFVDALVNVRIALADHPTKRYQRHAILIEEEHLHVAKQVKSTYQGACWPN